MPTADPGERAPILMTTSHRRRHLWVAVGVVASAALTACAGESSDDVASGASAAPISSSVAAGTGMAAATTTALAEAGAEAPASVNPTPATTIDSTVAPATTPAVAAPVSAAPPTTLTVAPPVPTAPPTTMARPTPTTIQLPVPAPPPLDENSEEPVVELGRVSIPKIGVDSSLYEGIRLPTFDRGPGHWPGTAAPGAVGNMVIGGHRTSGNADFRNLDQLDAGDEVVVTDAAGIAHTYLVESNVVTSPFAAAVVYQTANRTATLFACHPPGSTRQRIVVRLTLRT